ncbi:MAG: type II secretion system minor pseudopilin GspJ [Gammaproteobacteria bacterium]|nr:type II secretion system minor pseudopilin GspJ [Gammaproteobacteria bacterium]
MPASRTQSAFTLIEILVAIAVFAVIAALGYGALGQTLNSADMLNERMDRLQAIQRTVRQLSQDFMLLAPRPVRSELSGSFGPALSTSFQSGFAIEMTSGGWSNPAVLPRSTLQRAAYRIEEDKLVRYHWRVLDRTLSNEPIAVELLDDVLSITFIFLQANGEWSDQWPAQGLVGPAGARQRPRAVQFVLSLVDEGEITRTIEVTP